MDKNHHIVNTIRNQKLLAKKVIASDNFDRAINYVCGVDVSYKGGIANASAAIVKKGDLEVIEVVKTKNEIKYPYLPGLLVLRELDPVLETLKLLKNSFQLLLVDGHGVLHPRRCGLASYIGVITNNPTIGVAKNLLCGTVGSDGFVRYDGNILGFAIKRDDCSRKKTIYVSTGHRVSLPTSIQLVKSLTKLDNLIPEPLRIADIASKTFTDHDQHQSFVSN
jgi:deoxyribonuclease V